MFRGFRMAVRAVLPALAISSAIGFAPAEADPSAWARDNSGLTAVDPSLYVVQPRAENREYAFLSPDKNLLCGMPVIQTAAAFCVPADGRFPAALGMPSAAPGDPPGPPAQIWVVNNMNGEPRPSLTATNWPHANWPALSLDQVRVLPANSSLSATAFTCWARGRDEVHCAADRYVSACRPAEPSSCWARDDKVGFAVSSTRYELFDTTR